jgi:hypothetical protein
MCLQKYLFMNRFPNIKFLPTSLQNVYLHMYQKTTDDSIRRYFLNQLSFHKIYIYIYLFIYLSWEYRPAIVRLAITTSQ